ncbi:MAG: M3 family oligoendopeptidase [Candidatus Promineifilaceae bacterium]
MQLPQSIDQFDVCNWESYRPFFDELATRPLSAENQRQWLEDWSELTKLCREATQYHYIQKTLNTADPVRERTYLDIVENIVPNLLVADQALKQRLLTLEVDDADMQIMMRNLRSEVDLFREENVPLETDVTKLRAEYDKVVGGLSAEFDGEIRNLNQLGVYIGSDDRTVRKEAWEVLMGLWQDQREPINSVFALMLEKRVQIAKNANLASHREYAFIQRKRFSYAPEQCFQFHDAIEAAFVPAAQRIMERKRVKLGYETLKPWDWVAEMSSVVSTETPLQPFQTEDELIDRSLQMFNALDPELGRNFATMADEGLLDLMTRHGKAMGGYCSTLPLRQRPFIFMNAVGSARNVQTLLHEAGHAFHGFEAMKAQPLVWMQRAPMEFNEVASMAMELLASPNLTADRGGYYDEAQAAQHRRQHLEKTILFLPYMAVVDGFQHWLYTHPDEAMDSANLDAKWDELWQRFLPGIDWTGYETIRATGWHRKLHIFRYPFYYIEYGMAQMGAVQVWRNSLRDHGKALSDYRQALALGGTKTLPELFQAAGAEFRFDTPFISGLVEHLEEAILELS